MHNLQAAEDFKSELADARREICELEKQLTSERALADRLADALMSTDAIIRKEVSLVGRWDSPVICKEAIAAWKEARSERR